MIAIGRRPIWQRRDLELLHRCRCGWCVHEVFGVQDNPKRALVGEAPLQKWPELRFNLRSKVLGAVGLRHRVHTQ